MVPDIPSFRALYHELEEYRGSSAYEDVVQPWLPNARQAMAVLSRYGDAATRDSYVELCSGGEPSYYSCLERLYALSRVNDLLLIRFEPQPTEPLQVYGLRPVAGVTAEEYLAWWLELGMTQIAETQPFHPFYHEIVRVEQSEDPDEPVSVAKTIWPGFMLGQMLFSRAGVAARGGTNHVVKRTAETSRLYSTFARRNRPTYDDSHWWGHNSQWGTDFRRDYVTEEAYSYNVDAEHLLVEEDGQLNSYVSSQGLSVQEAIELMRFRCIVSKSQVDEASDDYDLAYVSYQEARSR